MKYLFTLLLIGLFFSCSEEENATIAGEPQLFITFKMDPNAERQDNLGDPIGVANGNAAQDPDFEILGLHFIGLYADKFTPFDNGETLYLSPTTEAGGANAIDFEEQLFITENDNTFRMPLSELTPGTYQYMRSSIGFQKFKISYNLNGLSAPSNVDTNVDVDGTFASFLGFNTYIGNYEIEDSTVSVNANKAQGYWGLESKGEFLGNTFGSVSTGMAQTTTVPNPIAATSPIPAGSCVVTGKFPTELVIPTNPTEDIRIEVTISINNSFEWTDANGNNKYEPLLGEQVVDMGTRGFFPAVQ